MIPVLIYMAGISYNLRSTAALMALCFGCGAIFYIAFSLSEKKKIKVWLVCLLIPLSSINTAIAALFPDKETLYAMAGITKIEYGSVNSKGEIK